MLIAVNTRFLIKDKLEGIGWFSFETIKRLVIHHPEHTFLFLFDRDFDEQFIFSDNIIPVKVWPPARHPYLWQFWFDYSLPRIFKKYKPDIFISPDGFLSLKSSVPTLLVIHDLGFEHYPTHTPALVSKYYRRYTPMFAHKATRIVTVSQFSKQDIITKYKIPAAKIDVVYNGANEKYVELTEEQKQNAKNKFAQGNNYFIYVGSIHPRKNLTQLLLAFDRFKRETANKCKLVIVGRMAWKTEETKQIFEQLEYQDAIIFTGHLQLNELTTVTGGAEALIYPSLFEGFGIPVLEARFCNVPIICSNTSSLPEVAGVNAIFFEPESVNSIVEALKLFIQKKNLGYFSTNDGEQAKLDFNWDATFLKFSIALQTMIDQLANQKLKKKAKAQQNHALNS